MKYIVTGGAGFIGSNLVDLLIEEGHEVHVIDNFSSGKKENCNEKAQYFELDISDSNNYEDLKKIVPKISLDVMKNLDLRNSVNSKKSYGGTSFENIKKMIRKHKKEIK